MSLTCPQCSSPVPSVPHLSPPLSLPCPRWTSCSWRISRPRLLECSATSTMSRWPPPAWPRCTAPPSPTGPPWPSRCDPGGGDAPGGQVRALPGPARVTLPRPGAVPGPAGSLRGRHEDPGAAAAPGGVHAPRLRPGLGAAGEGHTWDTPGDILVIPCPHCPCVPHCPMEFMHPSFALGWVLQVRDTPGHTWDTPGNSSVPQCHLSIVTCVPCPSPVSLVFYLSQLSLLCLTCPGS